jgi:hypothetical protein
LDGDHISGRLKDLMPLFVVAAPLSFIAPVYTLPVLLGGNVQGYVITEWIHHCMHFYRFQDPAMRAVTTSITTARKESIAATA